MSAKDREDQHRILEAENRRLSNENQRLNYLLRQSRRQAEIGDSPQLLRKTGIVIFAALATLILLLGNILFWAGGTIVDQDRYVATVSPLIKQPAVQDALASYTTQQLFSNFDAEQYIEEALPPRAAFLAPTISKEVQETTESTIKKVLQRPQFQARWNKVQENAHAKFIEVVKKGGSNGSIDLNDLYRQISGQLKNTQLAFLADKQLPSKVGTITVVEGDWVTWLNRTINHINLWRVLALVLLVGFSFLAVWLSVNRRRTAIWLASLFAVTMAATLIAIQIAKEVIADKVDPQYAAAAREVAQTVLHPLAVQSTTILVLALVGVFTAWISGSSKYAIKFKSLIQTFFTGALHRAIFGAQENSFSNWLGRYKAWLQWAVVLIGAIILLFIRLTPKVLVLELFFITVFVLLIEILSARQDR